jgi:hypothetical protein
MNNTNLTDFKNDFYNLVKVEDILVKYSISKSTYFVMIKKLGLKRQRSSKMLRTFNMNLSQTDNKKELEHKPNPNYIPKKIEPKTDLLDEELIYEKQYVPRNTTINVEKQKTTATKPKPKQVVKKENEEQKQDDTNNKSELLNAINRSTKVREKLLNKKNTN